MKRSTVLCFLLLLHFAATAQSNKSSASKQVSFGLKGGINFASMAFTDPHLSSLPQNNVLKPIGGFFVDIPLSHCFAIVPELVYVERGMATHYLHYSGNEVDYSILSRYIDFRLPILFGITITSWLQPYLVMGGDAGYLWGGRIHLQQPGLPHPDLTADLGKANMSPLYLGIFGGVGLRFFKPINGQTVQLKIEATYNHDVVDSFSEMEHNDAANSLNVSAYNITGERFIKGLETTIGIVVPLMPDKNDACYSFSKNKWK